MKIIRYLDRQDRIRFAAQQEDGTARVIDGHFPDMKVTVEVAEVARLLAPVDARMILAIGLNYKAHAEETKSKLPAFPMLFMKSPSTVIGQGAKILLPRKLRSDKVDYEAELAVVIGRACRNVSRADAHKFILGYTCANDVSARDWQKEWGGGQFCRGKTFDTFCPLGPCLVTTDEIPDPSVLRIQSRVNGEQRQDTLASDMIFDVPALIEFLSGSTTLIPGTVILTGTPSGVGMGMNPPRYLQAGDRVTISISGIGDLENPVAEEVV